MLNLSISEIMSKDLVTVDQHETIRSFENYFTRRQIHHIIVENQWSEICGIISSIDLAKIQSWIYDDSLMAKQIMAKDCKTLYQDQSIEDAITVLLENKYRAIPIIDLRNRPVGILTPIDIMKYMKDALATQKNV